MKYSYSGEDLRTSQPAVARQTPEQPESEKKRRRTSSWRVPTLIFLFFVVAVAGVVWFLKEDRLGGLVGRGGKEADGAPTVKTICRADEAADWSIADYLTPTAAEMRQLYNYVVESPFVVRNPDYYGRIAKLPFVYVATNDIVNAAAMRRAIEKDGQAELIYSTEFLGGAARFARLVGLAAAWQDAGHAGALKAFIALMPQSMCCSCSEREAAGLIAKGGLSPALVDAAVRQRALSYSSGMIVSVIAHEMGHHALGHMTGFYEKKNLEIERNQEREADSFASSVISSSSFGEYVFAGTLFWHYAVAMQADGDSDLGDNHPLSRERFENFVRANAEKAAAMGIVLK